MRWLVDLAVSMMTIAAKLAWLQKYRFRLDAVAQLLRTNDC